MSPRCLHLIHAHEERLAGICEWLAQVQRRIQSDASWSGWRIVRTELGLQADFDVPTFVDSVKRAVGPVVIAGNVQRRLLNRVEEILCRTTSVTSGHPFDSDSLYSLLIAAKTSFEQGEPLVSVRELLAFRIVRKLHNKDAWGGTAKNKSFLWSSDLVNGGFPNDYCDPREILNAARALVDAEVITDEKISKGEIKYGLGDKAIVEAIISDRSFRSVEAPSLKKFFEKDHRRVSVRTLDE